MLQCGASNVSPALNMLQLLNIKNFKKLIHFGYRFSDSIDLLFNWNIKFNQFFKQLKLLDLHQILPSIGIMPRIYINNPINSNFFVRLNELFRQTNNLIGFKFVNSKTSAYSSNSIEKKIKIKFSKKLQFVLLDTIDEYCTYDFSQCNHLIGLKI